MKYAILNNVFLITYRVAKVFAWLAGIQTAILFLLATGAGAPLPFTSVPAIRFGVCLLVCFMWRANKVGNKSAR